MCSQGTYSKKTLFYETFSEIKRECYPECECSDALQTHR